VAGGRSVSKVNDEWFADEERVRASVGLLERPTPARKPGVKEVKCPSLYYRFIKIEYKDETCRQFWCFKINFLSIDLMLELISVHYNR
jgi:ariadne-1